MARKQAKTTNKKKRSVPLSIAVNARRARLLDSTLRRMKLKDATRLMLVCLFRLWNTARDRGEQFISPTVPELAKKLHISERSVQRAFSELIAWRVLTPVETVQAGKIEPTSERPGGNHKGTAYFFDSRELFLRIGGSDDLRDILMHRSCAVVPPWKADRWKLEPSSDHGTGDTTGDKGVTRTGDTSPNFSDQDQQVSLNATARRSSAVRTGDTAPNFSDQDQQVSLNATGDTSPIYSKLAHADFFLPSDNEENQPDRAMIECVQRLGDAISQPVASACDDVGRDSREDESGPEPSPFTEFPTDQISPTSEVSVSADAHALLAHLRRHGPTTYGAAATALGWGVTRAWRTEAELRQAGHVHIDNIGRMSAGA